MASIFEVIQNGSAAELLELLEENPENVSSKNEQGLSPVILAAYFRKNDMIGILTKAKPDLDIWEAVVTGDERRLTELLKADPMMLGEFSPDGFSLLHYAAFFGHNKLSQLLLEKGADIEAETKNPAKIRPLHSAVAARSLTIVKMLIKAGAIPDSKQQGGFTPLMGAAANGLLDIAQLLVEHGAQVSLRSDDGKTAVDFAREKNHWELVSLLSG